MRDIFPDMEYRFGDQNESFLNTNTELIEIRRAWEEKYPGLRMAWALMFKNDPNIVIPHGFDIDQKIVQQIKDVYGVDVFLGDFLAFVLGYYPNSDTHRTLAREAEYFLEFGRQRVKNIRKVYTSDLLDENDEILYP